MDNGPPTAGQTMCLHHFKLQIQAFLLDLKTKLTLSMLPLPCL